MKYIRLFLLVCFVFLLTGCPKEPSNKFDDAFIKNMNEALKNIQIKYDCSARKYKYTVNYDTGVITCRDGVNEVNNINDDGLNEAQRIRDDAIDFIVKYINRNYTKYTQNIESNRSTTDFILDVIDLGTGAATGISKGERPNQILGIALTAFRGGRRSYEADFYKSQTTPILIHKMDDSRAKVYASILENKKKDIRGYSMSAALNQLVNYFNVGNLTSAFSELGEDAASQARASQELVETLEGNPTVSDIPSIQHEQLSDKIFAQRLSLRQQLRDAIGITDAAKKAEQLKAIRGKYEGIWKDVEAQDEFSSAIKQMKEDADHPEVKAILAKTADDIAKESDDTAAAEYVLLLDRLNAIIKNDPKLQQNFLSILNKVNK